MVFFRVDSNPIIAGGHVMRCIALANECKEIGEQVCFLIADDNPISVLEEAGLSYIILNSDWRDLMTDVHLVKSIIEKEKKAFLIIDTYSISRAYVEALRNVCKIAYLGSKQEYLGEIDYIINYSSEIDYDYYTSNYGNKTKLLLGVSYAPLRKEFQSIVHDYKDRISRILLTTGNTERNHIISSILDAIIPILGSSTVDVVVGKMFENKEELYRKYILVSNVILHDDVKSMSALMKTCDLAISANGTTIYELSALGVPVISFSMVEEQVKSAEAMQRLGIIDYCGRSYENQKECVLLIKNRLEYYLSHNDELIFLANKAHQLIDGYGCKRIISEIMY
ncbi:MAG: UDP-2,4-diacetamido-2,4,6-trideoxy-beta-L-altropyranose hydrolase [Lachnospiraceae bacterium]|nr:UDP-2,4-diacetamido-2,4,6-trideoxy-beta-L-altropyranose hydrolase [Lachnospiraceae bacterium]